MVAAVHHVEVGGGLHAGQRGAHLVGRAECVARALDEQHRRADAAEMFRPEPVRAARRVQRALCNSIFAATGRRIRLSGRRRAQCTRRDDNEARSRHTIEQSGREAVGEHDRFSEAGWPRARQHLQRAALFGVESAN
jgi:hypothetical protein